MEFLLELGLNLLGGLATLFVWDVWRGNKTTAQDDDQEQEE